MEYIANRHETKRFFVLSFCALFAKLDGIFFVRYFCSLCLCFLIFFVVLLPKLGIWRTLGEITLLTMKIQRTFVISLREFSKVLKVRCNVKILPTEMSSI